MKTTQTTVNACPLSHSENNSRNGIVFYINNPANKIVALAHNNSGGVAGLASSTTINDAAWHHIAFNWDTANGSVSELFVDGISQGTATASAAWFFTQAWIELGDVQNSFWPNFVGHLAEFGIWVGRNLSTDEIKALAVGMSPSYLQNGLWCHLPLANRIIDLSRNDIPFSATIGSPSIVDHPRVFGCKVGPS